MNLDHQVKCPCGRVMMIFHVGDATPIRAAAARVRRAKFAQEVKRHGKRPPHGKALGQIRAKSEPTADDLAPEVAAFWKRQREQEVANPHRHYCACGSVVEHQPGDQLGAPRGKAVGRHGRHASDLPDTPNTKETTP